MSGLKDIVKNGWHPEKDVPITKSLKGLIGKGDKARLANGPAQEEKTYREPIPITSLRDPASFPPPPKHVATGATPSPPPGQPYRPPAAGASHQSYTSTHTPQPPQEEPPAPKPFRIDTTGLSTSHLPPPPVRRPGGTTSTPSPPPAHAHAKPPPPSLPPRLPPRTSTPSSPTQPPPPPVRTSQPATQPQGYLNQSAINSLSSKGISVPGFNIGSTPPTSTSPQPSQAPGQGTGASGTTWAQKRAALQTASSIHKDPTSISASDASSVASTFNNFRQRHGDQVASATSRANAFASSDRAATPPHPTPTTTPGTGVGSLVGKKKPPPPPPAKKPGLAPPRAAGATNQANSDAPPPPVPLATRPQF
ncbi:hypothetical protein CONLIGDRAFT_666659 [Coniochaeta ligniaria NRRL 30616]|uniref:Uncharacterized protein n=1 Tax=Coniochaeta ligniaria NRRL 30616 TaxID=1408157 RepID=A0A1J7JVD0_9PEZI|nr:hypothetical protein CONLIGDRAFT_666659 [Coniochaeta ligniaria NRRL 30616]